jgi:PAS domain-containing protein
MVQGEDTTGPLPDNGVSTANVQQCAFPRRVTPVQLTSAAHRAMSALEVGRDAPNGRAEPRPNHARRSIRTIPELKRQSSQDDLAAVSLLDALDRDERPSFAVRSQPATNADATAPLDLLYCNAALESSGALLARVVGEEDTESIFVEHHGPQHAFRKWLRGEVEQHDVSRRTNCYMFDGLLWTAVIVGDHKIVSGLYASSMWPDTLPTAPCEGLFTAPKAMPVQERAPTLSPVPAPKDTVRSAAAASPPTGTTNDAFDVTFPDAPASLLTDHVRFFRSIDWALTSLGPMGLWPPELRNVVNMCLSNIHPCVLFWGDEAIMIYNEAYIQIIGVLHPAAMGNSAQQVATEYWHGFQPLVDHVTATGRAISEADCPVFVTRRGFLEETFWSFQCIPVLDCHGHIAGYYQPIIETTGYAFKDLSVISHHADIIRHKLLERRVSSLVELGSQTAKARKLRSYWERTLHTLTLNSKDVPFALLYAAEHAHSSDVGSVSSAITPFAERYTLEGSIGVEPGHPIAPASTDISKEPAGHVLLPFLLQAAKSRKAAIVTIGELGLSESDMDNISWKGFGDRCRTVVVCPLIPTSEQVEGFLILGINPRRPFDEDYQQFLHVMVRLLATSLASVVLFDEEVRQKEQAIGQAAMIQEKLLAELQVKEKRFQRFAARADIAIFILDPAGNFTYRNERWYDMFEVAATENDAMGAWANIVFPGDIPKVEERFAQLVVQKVPVTIELKTRILWVPPPAISQPEGEVTEHYTWILCSAYPEIDANGELVEVVGNVTDISRQKWAEGVQRIRTETALESKQVRTERPIHVCANKREAP